MPCQPLSLDSQLHHLMTKHPLSGLPAWLIVLLLLIGMTWGVPWCASASACAMYFPYFWQPFLRCLFSAGIVITVGVDAAWVVFSMWQEFTLQRMQAHWYVKDSKRLVTARWGAALLCACSSGIPGAYAALRYNTYHPMGMALVVFLGHFIFSGYGYALVFNRCYQWYHEKQQDCHTYQKRTMLQQRAHYLQTRPHVMQHYQQQKGEPLQALMSLKLAHLPNSLWKQSSIVCITFFIAINGFLVHFFLTYDAWHMQLSWPGWALTATAFITSIPGFAIACLTIGSRVKSVMNGQRVHSFIIFLSWLAPTATAFITFQTLQQHDLPLSIQYLATGSMVIARVLFSQLTLMTVADMLQKHQGKWHPFQVTLLHKTLQRIDPQYL
jgi:hypothetical protein